MRTYRLHDVTTLYRAIMAAPTRGPTYKVVLLGELGVGKTSLFRRLKDNTFDEYQTATTGIDSCTKIVKVDGETVMLSIWDTAGVERFRTLTRNYYRNAQAAVFVYSVAEASSLHYLAQWIRDTENFAPNATCMLIGNKIDVTEREIDETTALSFASAHKFELQFQTSCRTNEGIADAFAKLARALHKPDSILSEPRRPPTEDKEGLVELTDTVKSERSGCRC